jgi:hypothetical protein
MKLKSAFFFCLVITLMFGALTGLSYYAFDKAELVTEFFGACTMVFLMILPACSTTH